MTRKVIVYMEDPDPDADPKWLPIFVGGGFRARDAVGAIETALTLAGARVERFRKNDDGEWVLSVVTNSKGSPTYRLRKA